MRARSGLLLLIVSIGLSGCQVLEHALCHENCRSEARNSSSLVDFLYPNGREPPAENTIPELQLPVRVGLAFLPTRTYPAVEGLEAGHREALLERIRERFADRRFVSQIVVVPDYYLNGARGFEGLHGVQRLYNVDVMALVSYDQVTYRDTNEWSLGYLSIVGAYVLKGNRHDVVTLMDLAVVDPKSRSILLRAGGTDDRHGTTTLAEASRESRESRSESFEQANRALIENFDAALARFESDVKEGKANVRVTQRVARNGGGGGSLDVMWLALLAIALALRLALGRLH